MYKRLNDTDMRALILLLQINSFTNSSIHGVCLDTMHAHLEMSESNA